MADSRLDKRVLTGLMDQATRQSTRSRCPTRAGFLIPRLTSRARQSLLGRRAERARGSRAEQLLLEPARLEISGATAAAFRMLSMFVRAARGLESDLRAERGRSSDVDAVVLRLAEDRKKVCHLQHVAELLTEVKQFELASGLPGS